jgi:pyruvate/2-oxoacid:ferredoxin oxidoreductase alpha subunit
MKQVLKGNHAVAEGARLARVQVVSAYPITPQTTVVEELSEMCADGRMNARFIKVESEHSALAALLGASSAGARCFTATSGQGLLYMCEVVHWVAGARLPIVMTNVNRALAPGWNIWADQSDSLSQRDAGWVQIYAESNQEALDNVLIAFRLAETISLPVMLAYDAFFLSHTSEIVDVPEQADVDAFLPPYKPPVRLDVENPVMLGGLIGPAHYYEQRMAMHQDSLKALDIYPEIGRDFGSRFGREYGLVEEYRTENADLILVAAGTITSVSRLAVDRLREEGVSAGLMKIRMLRPVPVDRWRKTLGRAARVVVIDRNLSAGLGGMLVGEVRAALSGHSSIPVYSVVAGLGGRDVTPDDVIGIARHFLADPPPPDAPLFWGLKE